MKTTRRLLALITVLVMLLGLMSVSVLSESDVAVEPTAAQTESSEGNVIISDKELPVDHADENVAAGIAVQPTENAEVLPAAQTEDSTGEEEVPIENDIATYAAIAEDETCELCGGTPKPSGFQALDNYEHVSVCEHGKIVPNSKARHQEELRYDEAEHWYICSDCGQMIRRGAHYTYCDNPDVCAECGQPYTGTYVEHRNKEQKYNDIEHWDYCSACGRESNRQKHTAYCDNPKTCVICGQPCSRDLVMHRNLELKYNEAEHWFICQNCRQEVVRGEHKAYCNAPGKCAFCDQPYSGGNIAHYLTVRKYNNTEHWDYCRDCGYEGVHEKHFAFCNKPGRCYMCGSPYAGTDIRHDYGDEYQYNETEHWRVCKDCGQEYTHSAHYAYCTDPKTCAECGASYAGTDIRHHYDMNEYQYDETEHWYACKDCGEKTFRSAHYANCTDAKTCAVCGASYAGTDIRHNYNYDEYKYDETEHWHVCKDCGQEDEHDKHYANCTNSKECAICGSSYAGTDIRHDYDYDSYQYNETEHWHVCKDCGQESYHSRHYTKCTDSSKCADCGAPYTGDYVSHNYDYGSYEYNETEHWHVCLDCGSESEHQEHYANCTDLNKCAVCGAPYAGDDIYHNYDYDSYQYNATEHWHVCKDCGSETEHEEHRVYCDAPDKCAECGQPYTSADIHHRYDYDHYKYNETEHWYVCKDCGHEDEHDKHHAECTDVNKCAVCGASYAGDDIYHNYSDEYQYNGTEHWRVCLDCGSETEHQEHYANCTDPKKCAVCSASYTGTDVYHDYDYDQYQYDAMEHWNVCTRCGKEDNYARHYAYCDAPNKCGDCGAPYAGKDIRHHYDYENYQYSETEHWFVCSSCGHENEHMTHYAYCDAPNQCRECGAPYAGDDIIHHYDEMKYNDTEHWYICSACGYESEHMSHYAYCDAPNQCRECGAPYAGDEIYHTRPSSVKAYTYTATSHTYTCPGCGQVMTEAHEMYEEECSICGYSPNAKPTALPAPTPTNAPVVTATPEVTAAPEITATPEPNVTAEPTVSPEPTYEIFEGENSTWTPNAPGSDGTMTFRANGDFEKFTGVKVDGNVVPKDMYTAVSGSTIVTLKKEYLETLPAGEHTLTIDFVDGECATGFTITAPAPTATPAPTKKPASGNGDVDIPKTGDTSSMTLWYVVMFVCIATGIATVHVSKKRKFNR